MAKKITMASMAAAISETKRAETAGPVPGLYLIGRNGSGTWWWRRMVNGQRARLSLGPWPGVPLDDAIAKAGSLNAAVAEGRDPVAELRRAKAQSMTVRDAIARYDAEVIKDRRTRVQMRRMLERFLADVLDRDTRSVTHAEIGRTFNRMRAKSPSSARLAIATARPFWAWLHLEGATDYTINIDLRAVAVQPKTRVPSLEDIAALWNAAAAEPFPNRHLIQLLILTGLRRGEVAELRRLEVDMAAGVLNIGAERMKSGRAFTVPLAPAALAIVGDALGHAGGDLVLSEGVTPFGGWTRLTERLTARAGIARWSPHDLRRSLQTEGPDRLGIDPLVVDMMLAHAPRGMSTASKSYWHGSLIDQRRVAAGVWADAILAEAAKQVQKAAPKLVKSAS